MKGMLGLTTPQDLLGKLRYEHSLLCKDPNNAYTAFNFFVTAEHLLDWIYPGNANARAREDERNNQVLLQVVSHIASGAKHFDHLSSRHQSVGGSGRVGRFFSMFNWGARHWGSYFGGGRLVVRLTGDAAAVLGPTITALELAKRVLEFWQHRSTFSGPSV
jgi:hypothetical protein